MLLLSALAGFASASGAPSSSTNTVASVFTLPISPNDGRDPFFPESTRYFDALMEANQKKQPAATIEVSDLKVPGISGTPGHLLAIINNHTFAVGDSGEVSTPAGRVSLRCIEINSDHVVVEINGHYHRLPLEQQ